MEQIFNSFFKVNVIEFKEADLQAWKELSLNEISWLKSSKYSSDGERLPVYPPFFKKHVMSWDDVSLRFLLRKNGCFKTCWILAAFWGPIPGHNDRDSLEARTMFLSDPNVDNKVAASVRFTDLILVNALMIWWNKRLLVKNSIEFCIQHQLQFNLELCVALLFLHDHIGRLVFVDFVRFNYLARLTRAPSQH